MKISLTVFFSLLLSQSAFADTKSIKELDNEWIVESSAKYVLGDNDTRLDARNIALNEAKRTASEAVGTQVKSDLVIENDQILKDQINVIASSFMSTEIINEAVTTSKDNRSVLEITIRAHLDKTATRTKLDSYKGDNKKQKELIAIQAENARLQAELAKLNEQLSNNQKTADNSTTPQPQQTELIARRGKIITSLEDNQGQVRKVFEKGSLLSMAKQGGENYKQAVKELDEGVFGYIKNNTTVTLGDPEFKDNGNGTYDVTVEVQWTINSSSAKDILNKYFNAKINNNTKDYYLKFYEEDNKNEKQKFNFSSKLFSKLYRNASVKINIGKHSSKLQIAGRSKTDNHFEEEHGFSVLPQEIFEIYFNSNDRKLFNSKYLVVIHNVPASELKNLSEITAQVVIENE